MKTRIIRIGNSQGIRIPKSFLQRSKLTEEVELEAFHSYIVAPPTGHDRDGRRLFRRQLIGVEYEPVDENFIIGRSTKAHETTRTKALFFVPVRVILWIVLAYKELSQIESNEN
jgi:antitoxin component of MazEF toxin-antitoxin module